MCTDQVFAFLQAVALRGAEQSAHPERRQKQRRKFDGVLMNPARSHDRRACRSVGGTLYNVAVRLEGPGAHARAGALS